MKKILIIIVLFFPFTSFSQWGVEIGRYQPKGDMGFIFEKGTSIGVTLVPDFDQAFRPRVSLAYLSFQARMDTVPNVTYTTRDGITSIIPGYDIYEQFDVYLLTIGFDLRFLKNEKFDVFAGLDVPVGYLVYDHTTNGPLANRHDRASGGGLFGFGAHLGTQYILNDRLGCILEAGWNGYRIDWLDYFNFGSHTNLKLSFLIYL